MPAENRMISRSLREKPEDEDGRSKAHQTTGDWIPTGKTPPHQQPGWKKWPPTDDKFSAAPKLVPKK
jgi:hypothetical protein